LGTFVLKEPPVASKNPALSRAGIDYARACQTNDPEKIAEARGDLNAAKIQAFIEKTLADAPPLTAEQRKRLARLLSGGQR